MPIFDTEPHRLKPAEAQSARKRTVQSEPKPVPGGPRFSVADLPLSAPGFQIGAVDDPAEMEADRIAARILPYLRPGPSALDEGKIADGPREIVPASRISRSPGPGPGAAPVFAHHAAGLRAARGGGTPLPDSLAEPLGTALGQPVRHLRVHNDERADELNTAFCSRAFNAGPDLFFKRGEYQPHTDRGRELIAHETVHALQGGDVIRLMRWTWTGETWRPESKTDNRPPAHRGQAQGEVYDDELELTVDHGEHTAAPNTEERAGPDVAGARRRYDALGTNKWMEFIDSQHHFLGPAAYDETNRAAQERGYMAHTGDRNLEGFLLADNFVSQTLGQPLDADMYDTIHGLATLHWSGNRGWRTGEVRWGIPAAPSRAEQAVYEAKGLRYVHEDGRHLMQVPALVTDAGQSADAAMKAEVNRLFREFYEAVKQDGDRAHLLISGLYQTLEALHPFRDATSRTNHLVLNKLLVEHGFAPAVLQQPNSPSMTAAQWDAAVHEASARHTKLAGGEAGAVSAELLRKGVLRREHQLALAAQRQMADFTVTGDRADDRYYKILKALGRPPAPAAPAAQAAPTAETVHSPAASAPQLTAEEMERLELELAEAGLDFR